VSEFVRELNVLYRDNPSLWEVDFSHTGFKWMDFNDVDNSIVSFARFAKDQADHLVCLFNFTPETHYNYKVGVPTANDYREILNSDSDRFGGSNIHNPQLKKPHHEQFSEAPYHITVSVPPLGGIILQPQATDK